MNLIKIVKVPLFPPPISALITQTAFTDKLSFVDQATNNTLSLVQLPP